MNNTLGSNTVDIDTLHRQDPPQSCILSYNELQQEKTKQNTELEISQEIIDSYFIVQQQTARAYNSHQGTKWKKDSEGLWQPQKHVGHPHPKEVLNTSPQYSSRENSTKTLSTRSAK